MYHLNCNYIITIEYKINEIEFLQKVLREGTFLNLAIWFQFSLHFMTSFMRAIIPIMRFQRKKIMVILSNFSLNIIECAKFL